MTEIILILTKEEVYEEVAKTTSYTGAKMPSEDNAYDRILTTDDDKEILDRFWAESKNIVCNNLKKVLSSEVESESGEYTINLDLSASFDVQLTESMQRSLFSFFVANIISKWFVFTNKKEANDYMSEAATYMDDIMRKAVFKKKPTRPTFNIN